MNDIELLPFGIILFCLIAVAELYSVETKEVNQAVKNNLDKFPHGYIIKVTQEEKQKLVKIFDQFNPLKQTF